MPAAYAYVPTERDLIQLAQQLNAIHSPSDRAP